LNQGDILTEAKKQKLDQLVADDQLTCGLCEVAIGTVQAILSRDNGEDLIASIVVEVCIAVSSTWLSCVGCVYSSYVLLL